MSTASLLKTPLHDWHANHDGHMVDFAGWSMPVRYGKIIEEHHQTRNAIGVFDVSHMGRLYFSGDQVDTFLDSLTTRRVAGFDAGKIRYSLMTNENGGILDDVLVYHLPDLDGSSYHMMVVNGSNREKIVSWINSHLGDSGIAMNDRTLDSAMIAIQGPKANAAVAQLSDTNPDDLKYYTGTTTKVCGHRAILSRTGYTGEDGCEVIVDSEHAVEVWSEIMKLAKNVGGGATGLAARDTLRIEAAMPLYGHELNEEINAAQTNLGFAINMKDRKFIGKSAILAARKDTSLPVRVGFELQGKRPARDCDVFVGNEQVGVLTSGTVGPTIGKTISMGYIAPEHSTVGTEVTIDIRGKSAAAQIVEMPFYKRS